MTAQEGTIHFAYALTPGDAGLGADAHAEFAAWRSILKDLELLGQHPDRYDGFGYGNLSCRSRDGEFIITASQTSGAPTLPVEDLVRITDANLERFWVDAVGAQPPSSESLTHAMLYAADPRVSWVFHVHSPAIWQARDALKLPTTSADVPYGSPAMARAVADLMESHASRPFVFATAGHEDGVFAAGTHARDCGGLLVSYLARARALDAPIDAPADAEA